MRSAPSDAHDPSSLGKRAPTRTRPTILPSAATDQPIFSATPFFASSISA